MGELLLPWPVLLHIPLDLWIHLLPQPDHHQPGQTNAQQDQRHGLRRLGGGNKAAERRDCDLIDAAELVLVDI